MDNVFDTVFETSLDRRQFLARCGLLGAGLAVGGLPLARASAADPAKDLLGKIAAPAMELLARDTISGMCVFSVPGPDKYSNAQGLTSPSPGAIEAKGQELLLTALDNFLPLPDTFVHSATAAFATAVSDQAMPPALLQSLGSAGEHLGASLDQALISFLGNNAAVPLSLLIALMLNFEAVAQNPASLVGAFPASPFASLKVKDKAAVFEALEHGQTDLIAILDANAPQPLKSELSGLLKYVAGTLLEFGSFVAYAEYGVFDRETQSLTGRPVGWNTTNYMPGRTTPANGWDDFKGYYQGNDSAVP
jgi:hypothetical protein